MKKYVEAHRNKILLFLILIIAFFSRLYFLLQEGFVTTDGAIYILAGKNLIENGKYEAFGNPELVFSPGYPIFIGIFDHFLNNPLFSAQFVSFISGIFLVYLAYFVGKNLHSKKVGLLASFLISTNVMLIILSTKTMSGSLALFISLLIVYIYFKLIDNYKNTYALCIGLLIGFIFLIRTEGVIFLILPIIFLLKRANKLEIKKAITGFFIILISFLLVTSPYIYFLYQNTGTLTLTGKSSPNLIVSEIFENKYEGNIASENYNTYEKTFSNYDEETNTIRIPNQYFDISLSNQILKNPINFFQIFARGILSEIKILVYQYNAGIFVVPLLYILINIFITRKRKINEKLFIISSIFILYLSIFSIFHIETRYLAQPYICLVFIVSIGCFLNNKNVSSFMSPIIKERILTVIRLIIIFASFSVLIINLFFYKTLNPNEHKIAATYISKNSTIDNKNVIIMSRKPFVNFYSNNVEKRVSIPYTSANNIIIFAKSKNVNYIIIDERTLSIRDNYEELTNLNQYSDDVKLVFEDNSIKPLKIFKIIK